MHTNGCGAPSSITCTLDLLLSPLLSVLLSSLANPSSAARGALARQFRLSCSTFAAYAELNALCEAACQPRSGTVAASLLLTCHCPAEPGAYPPVAARMRQRARAACGFALPVSQRCAAPAPFISSYAKYKQRAQTMQMSSYVWILHAARCFISSPGAPMGAARLHTELALHGTWPVPCVTHSVARLTCSSSHV